MAVTDYLLVSLLLFVILLYPLLRKTISLLEILVNKYIQSVTEKSASQSNSINTEATKTILNLRLLGYERIILFIERIKPDSLIPRTISPNMTSKEYQLMLMNEIRQEYEYNLSQQLYISENAWTITTNFKNNIITLINTAAADCKPESQAGELAKKILEYYISSDIKIESILKMIKADIQ